MRLTRLLTGISPLMGEKCSQGRLLPLALPLTPCGMVLYTAKVSPSTTSSRTACRSRRLFFKKSSLTHSVAPPLQTEPAALGFGLVLAANLKAAASIVLRCYKTILYKPLFLRSWLCGNSLYETEIGRLIPFLLTT